MAESRLGRYVVQHRYRVHTGDHDRLRALLVEFRAWMFDLGAASFEIWQDESDPTLFTELVGFDSWSHHQRVTSKSPPPRIEEAMFDFEKLIIGGWDGVETRQFLPVDLVAGG